MFLGNSEIIIMIILRYRAKGKVKALYFCKYQWYVVISNNA